MWQNMPGWLKLLVVVIVLAWLGLLPTAIHLAVSIADGLRSAAHSAVHSNGGG